MITGNQIRAARALISMSQDELAEETGLTPQAIRKIEAGSVTPREGTLDDITNAFYKKRIEFTDNSGVRFIPEDVEVLNGLTGLQNFFDQVYRHARDIGGIIRQNGIGDNVFHTCAPDITDAQGARMAQLVPQKGNIFVRAILDNGDMDFMYSEYAAYRWHPKNFPVQVPYYLFGDHIGIFAFNADPSPKIVLIHSPVIASVYSVQFDETWEQAEIPSKA
ncbi:MAG: helix-turn-helix domain-containing protein [Bdellovibrionales bacterium]